MSTQIFIQSKTGGREENQDFYDAAETQYGKLIIVCDGMGGHKGGRYAAELAVQSIIQEVSKSTDDNPIHILLRAIEQANSLIWEESNADTQLKGMGSTLVALLLNDKNAICCHIGDSRLYQLRNERIIHRTFDHSHVFELVRSGILSEEQARLSQKSNIITRALGISPTVEIEITDNLAYKNGDRFLLCTDGICGAVSESQLVEMVSRKSNIETVLTQLVEEIDSIGFAKGGKHDNLTAALIEMESNSVFQIEDTKQVKKKSEPLKKKKMYIYLILAVLAILLVLNFYFSKKEKQAAPKPTIETKIEKFATKDSINQIDTVKGKINKQ